MRGAVILLAVAEAEMGKVRLAVPVQELLGRTVFPARNDIGELCTCKRG